MASAPAIATGLLRPEDYEANFDDLNPPLARKQALVDVSLDRTWQGAGAEGTVQDNWLASFGDSTLDALVREALTRNPDLRAASARMRQAAEYLVMARAPMFPSVGIAGTGGLKASGGGADPSSALQGIVAAASWELDLWGRVRYARNAAAEDNVSAQADYEFARQSIAASVARAWFSAIQLSEQARLARQMLDSSNQLAGLAGDRERVGAGSDVDTALARANAHSLEDALFGAPPAAFSRPSVSRLEPFAAPARPSASWSAPSATCAEPSSASCVPSAS